MKEEEQLRTENAELLEWLSGSLVMLDAAEGGNSLHPWAQLWLMHDASAFRSMAEQQNLSMEAKDLRREAIFGLMQANSLLNRGIPWIWFQLGWNRFAHEDGPHDLSLAHQALDVALELEPSCRPAHLAMAWLLYQQQRSETNHATQPPESMWLGPIGEHLRKALEGADWENRVFGGIRAAFWWGGPIGVLLDRTPGSRSWYSPPYFVTRGSEFAAVQALDALADLVPESHRFWHAYVMADLVEGDALKLRWQEEALHWPVQDDVALLVVKRFLAVLQQRAGHLIPSLRYFHSAGEHVLRLIESDDTSQIDWTHLPWEWLESCPYKGGEVPEGTLDLFLKVVDVALAAWQGYEGYFGMTQFCLQQLGVLTAWAGCQLLATHDRERAQTYLHAALEFEQKAKVCADEYGEEEELPPVSGPEDWRVLTFRAWRDIFIEKDLYRQAATFNDRILELLPGDHDARDRKLPLAPIVLSMALQEQQSEDRMDAEMRHLLLAIQPEAPTSVSLPPDMAAKLQEWRKGLDQLLETSTQQQEVIEDLSNRVHDLAQKEAQLSPRAIGDADQRLIDELGSETFDKLLPDSRLFLETAEAFYYASERVASEIDAALIAVEYAKAVETELRTRFLSKIAEELGKTNYRGRLGDRADGRAITAQNLGNLSLGEVSSLLNSLALGDADRRVLRLIERIQPSGDALRRFADEIKKVADCRNEAAHIEKVSRDTVTKLRSLLVQEGFLKRLVSLIGQCENL